MKLKDFQKKWKHHINKGLSFHHIKNLITHYSFDFDVYLPSIGMNLQRGLVWTIDQKRALILEMLRDKQLAPFTWIQNETSSSDNKKFEVIDGKQRLTTMISFLNNEFDFIHEGQSYYFEDLPQDCKKQIELYDGYRVDVHYNYNKEITDKIKIEIFEEVNWLGTPQEITHFNTLKNKLYE